MLKSQSAAGRTCPQGAQEICAVKYKSSVGPKDNTYQLQSKKPIGKRGIGEEKYLHTGVRHTRTEQGTKPGHLKLYEKFTTGKNSPLWAAAEVSNIGHSPDHTRISACTLLAPLAISVLL